MTMRSFFCVCGLGGNDVRFGRFGQTGQIERLGAWKRNRFPRLFASPNKKAKPKEKPKINYIKEREALLKEQADTGGVISGGRQEIAIQIAGWTIEQYYRALQSEMDKIELANKLAEQNQKGK
jgi:hypothetical protein